MRSFESSVEPPFAAFGRVNDASLHSVVMVFGNSSAICISLSFISFAALLVKVTARTRGMGICNPRIRYAILYVKTLVFHEPAPAMMREAVSVWRAALVCSSLSFEEM